MVSITSEQFGQPADHHHPPTTTTNRIVHSASRILRHRF